MKIGEYLVGNEYTPFVIAEMSGNHNQSLERALQIVKAAADAGAHAIKLQTYTADSITINHKGGLFDITDPQSLWKNKNLYELYQEAHTPYEWHKPIFDYAKKLNLICFSSPFDEQAVDMLEELGAPAYKIASFENNHHPLLTKVAKTGKAVIMSTGVSTLAEVDESVKILYDGGCKKDDLALLKCTSTYPASPENSNILTIPHMKGLFGCHIGLSDHTMGTGVAVAAVALGAVVVEKHFCLSRADGGVDSAFSLEPHEFKLLVEETKKAWQALGVIQYGIQQAEIKSLNYKRSVYVVKDIKKGELITPENLRIIRPAGGMHPRYYKQILGKTSPKDFAAGTPFLLSDLF